MSLPPIFTQTGDRGTKLRLCSMAQFAKLRVFVFALFNLRSICGDHSPLNHGMDISDCKPPSFCTNRSAHPHTYVCEDMPRCRKTVRHKGAHQLAVGVTLWKSFTDSYTSLHSSAICGTSPAGQQNFRKKYPAILQSHKDPPENHRIFLLSKAS